MTFTRYTQQQAFDLLNKLFETHPDGADAKLFIVIYDRFIHAIDDLVDEKLANEPEFLLVPFRIALNLYNTNFWHKYSNILYPTMSVIHNTWADSVAMENSDEEWMKTQAKTLKGIGLEMYMVVVEILSSYEERRRCSLAFRENCHIQQSKTD